MSFLFISNKWPILRCGKEMLKISLENCGVPESSGAHITFNPHVSLGSLKCDNFSRLSLFLMSLTVLRNIGQVFYRLQLNWVCPMSSSWRWVLGQKIAEMKCSHHSKSGGHDIDITSPCWPWSWSPHWGCVCQVSALQSNSLLLPCPHCTLGSESQSAAHIQGEGFEAPLLWGENVYINYLELSVWEIWLLYSFIP